MTSRSAGHRPPHGGQRSGWKPMALEDELDWHTGLVADRLEREHRIDSRAGLVVGIVYVRFRSNAVTSISTVS